MCGVAWLASWSPAYRAFDAVPCCPPVGAGGLTMWTTWLAYLIAFMGVITFASGALGSVLILMLEEVVPLR